MAAQATLGAVRRRLGIVAVLMVSAFSSASPATAAPRQESIFEDDDLLLHSPPATVDRTLAELKALGVDRVRIPALWRDIAPESRPRHPASPGVYDERIARLDYAISSAYEHGLTVLLNPRGGAPVWAQGANPPRRIADKDAFKPGAKAFGAFVEMLGRRYSGNYGHDGELLPKIDVWSLWNEPNWGGLLQPQSERDKRTGRMHTFAPQLYRRLYRAGHAALEVSGHGGDVILIGETAPLGSEKFGVANPIYAARFYRDLFCLGANLRPLRGRQARLGSCGDFKRQGPLQTLGAAHHPYPVLAKPEFRSVLPDEIRLADSRRLEHILDAANRHGRVTGRIPVWYTEFGYQTNPPDPYRGVSLRRQAAWTVRSEFIAFRDRRVLAFNQFLLRDSPPQTQFPVTHRRYWGTYQTGLRFDDGRRKPVYRAYRLPFMALDAIRSGRPLRLWGLVRPGLEGMPQPIRIEHRAGPRGDWADVLTHTVRDAKGYFTVRLPRARAGQYRFVWISPKGEVASGPAVKR